MQLPSLCDLGMESRRLFHGRGGLVPGLEHVAVDWFAPVVLVTLYDDRAENGGLVASVVEAARGAEAVEAVVVQERHLPRAPKRLVFGDLPPEVHAREEGLRYLLNLRENQNHGFFLDMQPGRSWVRANASGARILNLFAYTCSLSVAALAGGAEEVVNLDMAGGALATGRLNHRLNFDDQTCRRARYFAHDLFKSWAKLRRSGPYDLVIIDPPTNQGKSFFVKKDYAKIVRRLPDLTHAGSRVLACLNSPHLGAEFLTDLFADWPGCEMLPVASGFEDRDPAGGLKALGFSP